MHAGSPCILLLHQDGDAIYDANAYIAIPISPATGYNSSSQRYLAFLVFAETDCLERTATTLLRGLAVSCDGLVFFAEGSRADAVALARDITSRKGAADEIDMRFGVPRVQFMLGTG
jgi:hypothetical protein